MPWNYRIFHTCYQPPEATELVHYFSFREVYYAEDGRQIRGMGGEAARPSGETSLALMQDHARMQEAWTRPVLTPADVPGYVYGLYERSPPAAAQAPPGPTCALCHQVGYADTIQHAPTCPWHPAQRGAPGERAAVSPRPRSA